MRALDPFLRLTPRRRILVLLFFSLTALVALAAFASQIYNELPSQRATKAGADLLTAPAEAVPRPAANTQKDAYAMRGAPAVPLDGGTELVPSLSRRTPGGPASFDLMATIEAQVQGATPSGPVEMERGGGEGPIRSSAGVPTRAQRDTEAARERERGKGGVFATRRIHPAEIEPTEDEPVESHLTRARRSFDGDLRDLPYRPPVERDRPERPDPPVQRGVIDDPNGDTGGQPRPSVTENAEAAPAPIVNFDGLDRQTWGNGSPPDTNGDVGPNHYIQTVNTSVGIFNKSTGALITAFTFDTLMAQGNFGNICDTDNFGDPVVLYDTFENRWIITDFAFQLDAGDNIVNPPGAFQCFAVSKTADPVAGGWNFYFIPVPDALHDYEKLGVWPDGIYMSANMFGFSANDGAYQNPRVWAINKQQMYAGSPTVQVVSFNGPDDFTLLPSNARLQAGSPPAGRPNFFVGTWNFLNSITVYKFHVDWDRPALSTFTGPDVPLAGSSWPDAGVADVPQSGTTNLLDSLEIRNMAQNQYSNIGGVESLWNTHSVRRGNTAGFAAPRWYQVDVTGGTVAPNMPQAATWDPNGADVLHRWMSSVAVDRMGNLALGYSTSSATTFPSIAYAGRLANDPVNTFSQTEQVMFAGTASQQTGSSRWGDYSAMTIDPNGCTFWFTTEYSNTVVPQTASNRWKTRIASFVYPSCTPVGAGGTVSGTVTTGPVPVAGATVAFGARTTTTNASGNYSFTGIPAGTYPTITATQPGFGTTSNNPVVVTDGGTTTKNFNMSLVAANACPQDTSLSDFQTGVSTRVDVNTNPGDIKLPNAGLLDQSYIEGSNTGTFITTTSWGGQTFIAGVTGTLTKVEMSLFCNGCTGTPPNITVSLRATSAGLPTGSDLATGTILGFLNGASTPYTVTFASPIPVTAGTQYALILRPVTNPTGSNYAWLRAAQGMYPGGQRVISTNNGATWTTDSTRDFWFRTYVQPFSGDFVSGVKDANPAAAATQTWGNLAWNASTPANTTLRFQVAASTSPYGPFNFVGPNNTGATFFTTTGASLAQFNGKRYLKYKAYLSTTSGAATPTLNDVTTCFANTSAGIKGDIAPRPNGDNLVQSDDVIQEQRFQIAADAIVPGSNEFAKADCAPLGNPDNAILSNDVIQVQRFQIGADPIQNASAPPDPARAVLDETFSSDVKIRARGRELRIYEAPSPSADQVTIDILVNAIGDESAYGFTLNYEAGSLRDPITGLGKVGGVPVCNAAIEGQLICSVGGFGNDRSGTSTDQIGEIRAGRDQLLLRVTLTRSADASPSALRFALTNVNGSNDAAANLTIASPVQSLEIDPVSSTDVTKEPDDQKGSVLYDVGLDLLFWLQRM